MIKKIVKIQNFGILEDLKWGSLNDFNKINLIFGWNGTGKTSLSRFFRNFELGQEHKNTKKYTSSNYELELQNGTKATKSSLQNFKDIRVFNKDFIDESIFRPDNNVSPIYYLGSEQIDLTKEKQEKKNKEDSHIVKKTELEELSKNKDRLSEKAAKQIKDTITAGADDYQFYYKNAFEKTFELIKDEILRGKNISEFELDQTVFDLKLKSIKNAISTQKTVEKIFKVTNTISNSYLSKVNSDILEKIIVVPDIIEKLKIYEVRKWIEKGISLHNETSQNVCLFCDQELPENKIKKLEEHFNDEYRAFDVASKEKINELDNLKVGNEEVEEDNLKAYAGRVNNILQELKERVESKQKNLLEKNSISPEDSKRILDELTLIIEGLEKPDNIVRDAQKKLELSIIASEYYRDYLTLIDKINLEKKEVEKLSGEIHLLSEKIDTTEKALKDHLIPATKINEDLANFFGHTELTLEESRDEFGDICYRIQRNLSTIAENLSEGEKTVIALVYFLKKINEKDFDLKNGVVVIDDPISSLDSQFLYSAYSFVCEGVKDCKQVFILTHNYDFFSLLKREYCDQNMKPKPCLDLYMCKISLNGSKKRISSLYPLDPLLKNFDSDYQYLFSKLWEFHSKTDPEKSDLEIIYPYPNIARRFLETFLSFKFPQIPDLRGRLNSITGFTGTQAQKDQMYRFINIHSHSSLKNMEGFGAGLLEPSAKDTVGLVLRLIEDVDTTHYEGLKKLV